MTSEKKGETYPRSDVTIALRSFVKVPLRFRDWLHFRQP